jgi:hypothetical protein
MQEGRERGKQKQTAWQAWGTGNGVSMEKKKWSMSRGGMGGSENRRCKQGEEKEELTGGVGRGIGSLCFMRPSSSFVIAVRSLHSRLKMCIVRGCALAPIAPWYWISVATSLLSECP